MATGDSALPLFLDSSYAMASDMRSSIRRFRVGRPPAGKVGRTSRHKTQVVSDTGPSSSVSASMDRSTASASASSLSAPDVTAPAAVSQSAIPTARSGSGRAAGPACDRCRAFKKRCSRTCPSCELCTNAGHPCRYTVSVSDSVEVQQLRKQVKRLTEILNGNAQAEQNSSSGSSSDGNNNSKKNRSSTSTRSSLGSTHGAGTTSDLDLDARLGFPSRSVHDSRVSSAGPQTPDTGAKHIAAGHSSLTISGGTDDGTSSLVCPPPPAHTQHIESPSPLDAHLVHPSHTGHAHATPVNTSHSSAVGLLASPPPSLPADAAARRFVDAYFRNVGRAYPFVDRSQILCDLEIFGTLWQRNRDSTMLYLVMAIGCTTLQRAGRVPEGTASRFEIAYADIIQECLLLPTLKSLQILVLLALYSLFDPTGVPVWSIVGIAARQAILCGLTRRSTSITTAEASVTATATVPSSASAASHATHSSPSTYPRTEVIDTELKHRLFWSIFVLDRMISASLGLSMALTDENADVPLPGLTLSEFASPERATHATILQTSRHVIQLRQIEDRILQQVHLRKLADLRAMAPGDGRALLRDIRASIENWYSSGSLLAPPPQDPADNVAIHSSYTWLNARYYHLLIMLHYPCGLNLVSSAVAVPRLELLRLVQRHLEATSILFQQRLLPLNRVTLCRLFPVVLLLLHGALWCAAQATPFPARDEATVLRAILEAFPAGWSAAHQAALVVRQFLHALSDVSAYGAVHGPIHVNGNGPFGVATGGPANVSGTTHGGIPGGPGSASMLAGPNMCHRYDSLSALLRPTIASMNELMYDVLGSSTSLVFHESAMATNSDTRGATGSMLAAAPGWGSSGGEFYGATSSNTLVGLPLAVAPSGMDPPVPVMSARSHTSEELGDMGWAGLDLDFL